MINIRWAKYYCKDYENIENYEEAVNSLEKYECHHRNEKYYSQTDLKKLGLYYDCPPCELIFLKRSEHKKLHRNKSKNLLEESKEKKRQAHLGKHHTEETKRKISESQKGRQLSEETKKKMSEARKKYWENKRKESE